MGCKLRKQAYLFSLGSSRPMKHSILIEFHTSKPLPDDFLDKVAGRIYIMDEVDKAECTATLLTQDQVDSLKETE